MTFPEKPGFEQGSFADGIILSRDELLFLNDIEIIKNRIKELLDLDQIELLLANLTDNVEKAHSNEDGSLTNFYVPLVAILYGLSFKFITEYKFTRLVGEGDIILYVNAWFFKLSTKTLQLITSKEILGDSDITDANDALSSEQVMQHDLEPLQWSLFSLVSIGQWFTLILSEENHCGNPFFYIYIKDEDGKALPESLPRIFKNEDWISGFGGRFLIPGRVENLTNDQKSELWNDLLVDLKIYGDETIDHSVREKVFDAIKKHLPDLDEKGIHLDLCGGTGIFIKWLQEQGFEGTSFLIDIADEAVAEASKEGVASFEGDAENKLEVEEFVGELADVVTIVFAVHLLSAEAFGNVINALKPGGTLIANVYPPDLKRVELFTGILEHVGFEEIKCEEVDIENGKKQYILSAKKPAEF